MSKDIEARRVVIVNSPGIRVAVADKHLGQHGDDCFGCRIKTIHIRSISAFQPHWNPSVGSYVQTELEFKDKLKLAAEENTLATGTYHNYEMRDPGELRETPFPQEDEILNSQAKAVRDAGI